MSQNSQESFNVQVFDKITGAPSKQNAVVNQGFWYYFKLSRLSAESRLLANFIIVYCLISLYSIVEGGLKTDFELISIGTYAILHISAIMFSLYALIIAKQKSDNSFTFGYSRYETMAAFSNCVLMIITALFTVLGSVHVHASPESDGEDSEAAAVNEEHEEDHDHNHASSRVLYVQYGLLVYSIMGAFAFAEYAMFVPSTDISKTYNISGVSQDNYNQYQRIYQKMTNFIHENITHTHHGENNKQYMRPIEQENADDHKMHKTYSSHYENMHSIFLNFLVDIFLYLGKVFSFHLEFVPLIGVIVSVFTFILVIMVVKRLLVVSSKLLLQALPIEDKKSITEFLHSVNKIEGVVEVVEKYFWGVTTGFLVCNMKLVVKRGADLEGIQNQVNILGNNKFQEICVQIEQQ